MGDVYSSVMFMGAPRRTPEGRTDLRPRLPVGEAEKTAPRELCQRPQATVKHRGSGNGLWWTCAPCQMRWKRPPVDRYAPTGEHRGSEWCTFGKYAGYAFKEIYRMGNPHCQWRMKTYESGEQPKACGFARLAK